MNAVLAIDAFDESIVPDDVVVERGPVPEVKPGDGGLRLVIDDAAERGPRAFREGNHLFVVGRREESVSTVA